MNVRALITVLLIIRSLTSYATDRSIDGSANNLLPSRLTWGAAETDVIRFGYAADYPDGYGDAIYGEVGSPDWPNARDVSNALSTQSGSVYNDRNLSDWIVQWGQFLTHDMDLTTNDAEFNELFSGATGDFSISINDPSDPLGPNPIPFNRSNYNPTTGTTATLPAPGGTRPNWREQINSVTSYIDASQVYGSDLTRAAALRTFADGKLITTADGRLPGLNTVGLENDDPFGLGAAQFLAGDIRANEQVGLTATHALFVREHNRLAGLLKANNPSMSDETIYQTARKIVGAEMQIVTYEEFLPALMGGSAPNPQSYVYNAATNASITNSFATAFFRFGHSMQSAEIPLIDNNDISAGSLSLRDAFFNPAVLQNSPETVDLALKGLASQVAQENDVLIIDDLRNFLFGPPGAGGLDLAALDIQRGRDHGMLDYNAFRPAYGLPRLISINQLTSDPALRAALIEIYGNIDSIDAFIGSLVENHVAGASIGAMLRASFIDQFTRLRDGDRFFYTGDLDLLSSTITSVIDLDSITLAEIMRLNTGISNIQDNVFFTFLEADFNEDGIVNSGDLAVWQSSYGINDAADADWDGDSDGRDFLIWQQQFGSGSTNLVADVTAVPEPATLLLLSLALASSFQPRSRESTNRIAACRALASPARYMATPPQV
jgi:peroxidase